MTAPKPRNLLDGVTKSIPGSTKSMFSSVEEAEDAVASHRRSCPADYFEAFRDPKKGKARAEWLEKLALLEKHRDLAKFEKRDQWR